MMGISFGLIPVGVLNDFISRTDSSKYLFYYIELDKNLDICIFYLLMVCGYFRHVNNLR